MPRLNKATTSQGFPPGIHHLYWFFFLNFPSCIVIMDSPIFLYAENLGASATVMGLIAGMTPLMAVFQLPAADHVNRVGYKRFVCAGWTLRQVFVLGLVAVPLLHGVLNPQSQLAVVLAMLLFYNLVRGIASCGWFPWITGLVPEEIRGRYLLRENACANVGSLLASLLAAWYLGAHPQNRQFAVMFVFSLVTGLVSLWFLYRVPDAPVAEDEAALRHPVPWGAILRHGPFRKLLWVNLAWALMAGGLMAFLVKFLKRDALPMPDDQVMLATSAKFVGGLATLWLLDSRLDRFGSRPLMHTALALCFLWVAGWLLMAGNVWPRSFAAVTALHLGLGFSVAVFGMALTRLTMATVPRMGRSHFFAIYSVTGSLMMGISPIAWGIFLDALQHVSWHWAGVEWNAFSLYFAVLLGLMVAVGALVQRVEETRAGRVEDLFSDFLRNSPFRFLRGRD